MKVKIQQRNVYHKFAEVEIEIPDDWNNKDGIENYYDEHINDYLHDNEDLWADKVDEALSKAPYHYGFGTDSDANDHHNSCMVDTDQESEWRYECDELKTGGHL